MNSTDIKKMVERASSSPAYKNYLEVRNCVYKMMDGIPSSDILSRYWRGEIEHFAYIFDASPLIIERLREHCFHITGLRHHDYKTELPRVMAAFRAKLDMLNKVDSAHFAVSESEELGGFGFRIDGQLVNIDTLKFYEALIALNKVGATHSLRGVGRKTVIEIGAGWGGFAYQFRKIFQDQTYIIVDLPETIIFSGTYLKTLFPNHSHTFLNSSEVGAISKLAESSDFLYVPHYLWGALRSLSADLIINVASFQEMTSDQVETYVKQAKEMAIPKFYSFNRNRSLHNNELTTVRSIMEKYYVTAEISVLDMQYNELPRVHQLFARRLIKKMLGAKRKKTDKNYRHLLGTIS